MTTWMVQYDRIQKPIYWVARNSFDCLQPKRIIFVLCFVVRSPSNMIYVLSNNTFRGLKIHNKSLTLWHIHRKTQALNMQKHTDTVHVITENKGIQTNANPPNTIFWHATNFMPIYFVWLLWLLFVVVNFNIYFSHRKLLFVNLSLAYHHQNHKYRWKIFITFLAHTKNQHLFHYSFIIVFEFECVYFGKCIWISNFAFSLSLSINECISMNSQLLLSPLQ